MEKPAVRRLLRDLNEVLNNPLPNVVAEPLEDDIFVWHGNVRGEEGSPFAEVPVHFVMVFNELYPSKAPTLRLYHAIPHPNVRMDHMQIRGAEGSQWRLALWDCVPSFDGWSSAYTVHSILVHLQAFLLAEDLHFDTSRGTIEQALFDAKLLEVAACGHTARKPSPAFPTPEQLAEAQKRRGRLVVSRPAVQRASSSAAKAVRPAQVPAAPAAPAAGAVWTARPSTAPGTTSGSTGPPSAAPPAPAETASQARQVQPPATAAEPPANGPSSSQAAPAIAAPANAAPANAANEGWQDVRSRQRSARPSGSRRNGANRGRGRRGPASQVQPVAVPSAAETIARVQPARRNLDGNSFAQLVVAEVLDTARQAVRGAGQGGAAAATPAPNQAPRGMGAAVAPSAPNQAPRVIPGWEPVSEAAAAHVRPLSKSAKKRANKKARAAGSDVAVGHSAAPQAAATAEGQAAAGPGDSASAPQAAPQAVPETAQQAAAPSGAAAAPPAPAPQSSASSGGAGAAAGEAADGEEGWQSIPVRSRPQAAAAGAAAAEDKPKEAPKSIRDKIAEVYAAAAGDLEEVSCSTGAGGYAEEQGLPMGPLLDALPPDVLSAITCLLEPKALSALGACCKGLRAACEDGDAWRSVLQRAHPGHRLAASSLADWKHAFLLQATNIVGELQCFHTKLGYEEEVLGLPIRFTVNLRTRCVDYIEPDLDLLSVEAFKAGVRKGVSGEAVQEVMPLYLTADHFRRALPALDRLLPLLAPERRGPGNARVPPAAWLDVIGKMLNTAIVLLTDKGIAATEKSVGVYCQLHRLLLALCEHYNLWGEAEGRLDAFVASPAKRTKAACPSLGNLIPLLSISPKHTWEAIGHHIISEGFDRSVIWMCKNDPALSAQLAGLPGSPEEEERMVKSALTTQIVSKRLFMFHVVFLRLVAKPPNTSLAQVMETYDSLYGRPGAGLQRRLRDLIHQIVGMKSWDEFLDCCGFRRRTVPEIAALLRQAWKNSLAKGYHKKETDFSRIQASGVSRILLKGETFMTPPNMKRIRVEDRWRYSGGMSYLDASCIAFGENRRYIEFVDWLKTQSTPAVGQHGCITHSGNIMNPAEGTGMDIINIELGKIGANVKELYITVAGWVNERLINLKQPYISIMDPATGKDMCTYFLDDQPQEVLESHTAVIMARFVRVAGGSGWEYQAVGKPLRRGYASEGEPYNQLIRGIQALP